MFFNFLLVGTLLSASAAVATPATGLPEDGIYRWKVSLWNAGCVFNTDGGCKYDFTIEGDLFKLSNVDIPPFVALCNSTGPKWAPEVDGPWAPCSVTENGGRKTVAAKLLAAPPDDRANLLFQVEYRFLDDRNFEWDFTGGPTPGPIDSDVANRTFNIDNIHKGT
ncbi:hypothetical protein HYFRA_00013183 [Hymenoscyphus fraxineus]|uniref:Uncharacterized protein n=1 Tax=Hymenoscyphus fraxineus TaxID=746836 RepID=A0A9N9L7F1_9HELO|nr:hypothetical protein HYFRA_00013183 [Hymenoscyphus fraxineus]